MGFWEMFWIVNVILALVSFTIFSVRVLIKGYGEVKDMLSQTHINARIMLDETKKDKFKKDMDGIRNINLLRACAEVERNEKNNWRKKIY